MQKKLLTALVLLSPLTFAAGDARAQNEQPQYQLPQPQLQPARLIGPKKMRYQEGDDIPPGYHLEEKPRTGLIIGGFVMFVIPYSIGVFGTLVADLENESSWLLLPVVGPWLTLGLRSYNGCGPRTNENVGDSLGCVADVFVATGLVIDGILQGAGAAMVLAGYFNPKTELVRNDVGLKVRPMTIGTGYGVGLTSRF